MDDLKMSGVSTTLYVMVFSDLLAPGLLPTGDSISQIDCGRRCSITLNCHGFFYDRKTSRCYLGDTTFGASDPSLLGNIGIMYYVTRDYQGLLFI